MNVEKANYCVDFLLTQMKKLGIDIEHSIMNKGKFREADVTKDVITKFNITKAIAEITELEKDLTFNPPFQLIQMLNTKYKQVIEYYSTVDDEKNFELYLEKTKNLMMIEDRQTTEVSKASSQPSE